MASFVFVQAGASPQVLAFNGQLTGKTPQAFVLAAPSSPGLTLVHAAQYSAKTPQSFVLVADAYEPEAGAVDPDAGFQDVDLTDPAYADLNLIADHCEQAKDRLMDWARKPKIQTLICLYAERIQALEQQLANLLLLRSIWTSLGAQLDKLGVNLGVKRNGLGDEDYRVHLVAKTKVIACDGTAEEIMGIIRTLDNGADEASIRWESEYPAGYNLFFTVPAGGQALAERWVRQFLRPARDSGIQAWHFFHQRDTRIFAWAEGPYDPAPGVLTGWAESGTPGGTWAEVL